MDRPEGASEIERATEALAHLSIERPELAEVLARLTTVIVEETLRTPRFAARLLSALSEVQHGEKPRRPRRRNSGAIDPFEVYSDQGEAGLRARLGEMNLDQLKDIVAEHGMDHDRLAMKWKDPTRVIDRIVDKVSSRASKGSAFRPAPD